MAVFPVLLLLFLLFSTNATNSQKPNIVVFMADDLGIGDIGCYGNSTIRTPNIDRLAKEGVTLTQHIAAASLCTPSRAAFMTGRYPIRSGMSGHDRFPVLQWTSASGGLPPNETTFTKILKKQGYTSGLIGKWHLGVNCDSKEDFCHHPLNHGFDYFYGTTFTLANDCNSETPSEINAPLQAKLWIYSHLLLVSFATITVGHLIKLIKVPWKIVITFTSFGIMVFIHFHIEYIFYSYWNCILMRNYDIIEQPINLETTALKMIWEAKEFIISNRDGPFLLFVSFLHVHVPLVTTKKFTGKSQHGLYGDNVEEMDWMIGEILNTIEQEGLVNNTLTYFTSDHGGYLESKFPASNGIYSGGKGMGGLEGGIRIPGIFRWPGVLPANTVIDEPTSHMDIFSTFIILGGGKLPPDRIIDGKDLMPLLQGQSCDPPHEFLFHYCTDHIHAVRWYQRSSGTVWKMHYMTPKFTPEGSGACHGSQVCACFGDRVNYHVPPLLFNISGDPAERYPVSSDLKLYKEVLQIVEQAVANHKLSIYSVPQQLYRMNNIWNPRLQLCCGQFPFCWCNKDMNNKAVCDADMRLQNVLAGFPGSNHNAHILRQSFPHQYFESGPSATWVATG
ncbi:arylsulfatase D-like [Discoglossus pictus]